MSQVGEMGGDSRVSVDGAGFRSVSEVEFEREHVAMVGGLFGFMSRLSDVGGSQLKVILCSEAASSSSQLYSLTSSTGTGWIDASHSLSLFLFLAIASFLRLCHTDFIVALGFLMSGSIGRDGSRPFLFVSCADMMNISGASHTLSTFVMISL